jgi:hypothetical protein
MNKGERVEGCKPIGRIRRGVRRGAFCSIATLALKREAVLFSETFSSADESYAAPKHRSSSSSVFNNMGAARNLHFLFSSIVLVYHDFFVAVWMTYSRIFIRFVYCW